MALTPLQSHVTANSSGGLSSELRYRAWGEYRYISGTTPTSNQYTGQRVESTLGIYFYQSRWYDPYLNRWIQPDSIIPDPYISQEWDRYAYSRNNPVRYTDPSGHLACSDSNVADGDCSDLGLGLWRFEGIVSTSGKWTSSELSAIRGAVAATGTKISTITGGTPWEAFKKAYGHVKFTKSSEAGNLCLGGTGSVSCFSGTDLTSRLLTHELGHAFSWAHGTDPYGRLEDEDAQIVDDRGNWVTGKHTGGDFERTILGYKSGGEPDMYHGPEDWTDWNSNADNLARNEDYADMFMNWVYDSFDYRANAYNAGTYRYEWMTTNVAEFVR
jgi:RHS repeat-associated protein